jgi:hypothetical protein
MLDEAQYRATVSLISEDQGVCPLGHPCFDVLTAGRSPRRTCDERHPESVTGYYVGMPLIRMDVTAADIDRAEANGADEHIVSWARSDLADRSFGNAALAAAEALSEAYREDGPVVGIADPEPEDIVALALVGDDEPTDATFEVARRILDALEEAGFAAGPITRERAAERLGMMPGSPEWLYHVEEGDDD